MDSLSPFLQDSFIPYFLPVYPGAPQRSTGPKTAQGKTKSSLNAVKTGLTSRTVLLPSEDADAYREHVNAYVAEFAPVGLHESALVQSLADHAWRLDCLVTLEMGIYAFGHAHFAENMTITATSSRCALISPTKSNSAICPFKTRKDMAAVQQIRLTAEAAAETQEKKQLLRPKSTKLQMRAASQSRNSTAPRAARLSPGLLCAVLLRLASFFNCEFTPESARMRAANREKETLTVGSTVKLDIIRLEK